MPKVLCTTPSFDDITHFLREWSREIIDAAKIKGWDVYPLDKDTATRKNFESRIEQNNPNFLFLNGHGGPDVVYGHKKQGGTPEQILKCNENEELTRDRIVYARACNSLEILGLKCVEGGAKAYIGYKKRFVVPYSTNKYTRPLDDEISKPFMEISNIIPSTLIKGKTIQEAIDRAFQQFLKNVEYQETHYTLDTPTILYYLIRDTESLGAFGDPDTKIT